MKKKKVMKKPADEELVICPSCGSKKMLPYEGIRTKKWTRLSFFCENSHVVVLQTFLQDDGTEKQEIFLE